MPAAASVRPRPAPDSSDSRSHQSHRGHKEGEPRSQRLMGSALRGCKRPQTIALPQDQTGSHRRPERGATSCPARHPGPRPPAHDRRLPDRVGRGLHQAESTASDVSGLPLDGPSPPCAAPRAYAAGQADTRTRPADARHDGWQPVGQAVRAHGAAQRAYAGGEARTRAALRRRPRRPAGGVKEGSGVLHRGRSPTADRGDPWLGHRGAAADGSRHRRQVR